MPPANSCPRSTPCAEHRAATRRANDGSSPRKSPEPPEAERFPPPRRRAAPPTRLVHGHSAPLPPPAPLCPSTRAHHRGYSTHATNGLSMTSPERHRVLLREEELMSDVKSFGEWFRSQCVRLHALPSGAVAEEVANCLSTIDDRLGVEVERGMGSGEREIVLTAFSNPDAFPVVRRLAEEVGSVAGWKVVALKQPRGFAFSIGLAGQKVKAETLRYRAVAGIAQGYELIAPGLAVGGDGAEEAAWLIVETGVGEELAGHVQHLGFRDDRAQCSDSHPICEIGQAIRSSLARSTGGNTGDA